VIMRDGLVLDAAVDEAAATTICLAADISVAKLLCLFLYLLFVNDLKTREFK
jgi:hypothetical protein